MRHWITSFQLVAGMVANVASIGEKLQAVAIESAIRSDPLQLDGCRGGSVEAVGEMPAELARRTGSA